MNFPGAGYGGNEGRRDSAAEIAHLVEGKFQSCGHVLGGHVPGGEHEFADGMNFQRAFLEQVVSDAFIAGQQDPTL
jgi:hypothetical protein